MISELNDQISPDAAHEPSPNFQPTRWSLVRSAGNVGSPGSGDALEALCRTYWSPLYAFIRRSGHSPHDAQDLAQEFFSRFLESNSFVRADPRLGKFRTFLLGA